MVPSAGHKHHFYMEMAKLLEAGFDIRKAAGVLKNSRLPTAQAIMLKNLEHGLDSGETIAQAFGKDTAIITELERSIIRAGERGGKLALAFQHLADYFGMLSRTRNELIRGMIYPFVVMHLGIVIAIVPRALMQATRSSGEILGSLAIAIAVLYSTIFLILLGGRALLAMTDNHRNLDRLINHVPWVGSARSNMAMARFCKVYHSCLLAGIPMTETVRVSTDASQSAAIKDAGDRLVEVVRGGNSLGPQFVAENCFPEAFSRSYLTGEEAGTLDLDLARWSNLFQSKAEASARAVGVMIPKLLYFFIMLFVAWQIVGFFHGYYSSMEEMMK